MKYDSKWPVGNDDDDIEDPFAVAGGPFILKRDILTVESISNHIYFYSTVNPDRCLALMRELREVDQMLTRERIERNLPDDFPKTPIWLHIQSPGGYVFPAFGIADQYKKLFSPVYSIVEGYAASAATTLTMAAVKRYIQPSAFMLIHQVSSIAWGTYSEIQDEMHLLDMLMERISGFYHNNSTMELGVIKELLKRDSWFNALECLERGMVDEVLE